MVKLTDILRKSILFLAFVNMGGWHMPLFYRLKIYRNWRIGQKKRGSIMEKTV